MHSKHNKALELLLKKKEENQRTLHSIEAVKMVTLLVLRNQGWGHKRLKKFNEEWNTIIVDVSNGWLSLSDIADTIYDEVGLGLPDLRIK